MKTLLFLLLIFPLTASAQSNKRLYRKVNYQGQSMRYHEDYFLGQYLTSSERKEKKMAVLEVKQEDRKGRSHSKSITFNSEGNITEVEEKDLKINNHYQGDTLMLSKKRVTKKSNTEEIFEYKEGKLVAARKLENDKEISMRKFSYNKAGKRTETHYYFGKKLKNHYLMKHEYDESNKRIKTMYYMNDEVMKIWTYECEEKGTEIEKKSVNVGFCVYKAESNDGSYIKYQRRLVRESVYLRETHYSKDSVFMGSKEWLNDSLLIYDCKVDKKKTTVSRYSAKGKYTSGYIFQKNDDNKVIERTHFFGKKKKQGLKQMHAYENGLLTSTEREYKGKTVSKLSYIYTFR